MAGVGNEMSVFLQALLAGNVVYWTYYLIHLIRKLIRHNLFFVSLEDFFYWIGVGFYLFVKMFNTSDGSIRWYFILGVVVGAILPWIFMKKCRKKFVAHSKKTR